MDQKIRYVLFQKQDDIFDGPIRYQTKIFNDGELILHTTHQVDDNVMWAILLFRPYLERTKFTVWTEHHAFKWVLNLVNGTEKLAKWSLRGMEYFDEIIHWAGVEQQARGTLSRLTTVETADSDKVDELSIRAVVRRVQIRPKEAIEVTTELTFDKATELELLNFDMFWEHKVQTNYRTRMDSL